MSDSDDEEYLNCYSTSNTKHIFKKQIGLLKKSKNETATPTPQPTLPPSSPENESASARTEFPISEDDKVLPDEAVNSALESSPLDDGFVFPEELLADTSRTADGLPQVEEVIVLEPSDKPDPIVCANSEYAGEATQLRRSKRKSSKSPGVWNQPEIVLLDEEAPNRRISKRNTRNSSKQRTIQQCFLSTKPKRKTRSKKSNDTVEEINLDETLEDAPEDDINYQCNVKIVWKSTDVVKIPVRRLQKLNVVFEHFMKEENVCLEKIILTLNGKTLKPTDTPESLNLNVTDFLEGGVVSTNVSYQSSQTDASKFSIKFQDCLKKSLTLALKFEDKMKIVLLSYAEQIDKPLTALKFMFDGCLINYDDTPESLGMENGDVVDVIVKN